MHKITVVGLGAGSLEGLPLGLYKILKNTEHLYMRTDRHPAVAELAAEGVAYKTFDEVYEAHDQFPEVYEDITSKLLELASGQQEIVYAVPGHPLVAEQTVQLLLERAPQSGIAIDIKGGQSFLDPIFTALYIDPVDGFALLDATSLRADQLQPGIHTLICQVYDRFVASDLKLTLMEVYPDEYPVTIVNAAGIAGEEKIISIPLYELDRYNEFTNLTTLFVPQTMQDNVINRHFWRLKDIVRMLRSPEGCPWDREQTHQSIRKNLIEETYEVLETIDDEDPEAMCEEMGDLLLQIMLHSEIAEEDGYFSVYDVVQTLNEKLIRRHPHVFGEREAENAEEALLNWQEIKAEEKKAKGLNKEFSSVLDSVPRDLPSISRAYEYQKKAAEFGFDWEKITDLYDKVKEEWEELREAQTDDHRKEELGDLLFVVINLARFMKIDPEEALALTNRKFKFRFSYIERKLDEAGKTSQDTTLDEMDAWWREAKQLEKEK